MARSPPSQAFLPGLVETSEVQNQLEGEQQHLPLLDQVTLRWKGDHMELQSPERAIAWALENRADRIQNLLQTLTGKALRVEVRAGPGEAGISGKEDREGASSAEVVFQKGKT